MPRPTLFRREGRKPAAGRKGTGGKLYHQTFQGETGKPYPSGLVRATSASRATTKTKANVAKSQAAFQKEHPGYKMGSAGPERYGAKAVSKQPMKLKAWHAWVEPRNARKGINRKYEGDSGKEIELTVRANSKTEAMRMVKERHPGKRILEVTQVVK